MDTRAKMHLFISAAELLIELLNEMVKHFVV